MSYSVTLIRWKHTRVKGNDKLPKKDKLYPVYCRVSINLGNKMENAYIKTNQYVKEDWWDENRERVNPSHPLHEKINISISQQKRDITDLILTSRNNGKFFSAAQIMEMYKGSNTLSDIFAYLELFKKTPDGLRKSPGTNAVYDTHFKLLKEFVCHRRKIKFSDDVKVNVYFEEMNVQFMEDFENFINVNPRRKKEGNNYAWGVMKTMRTIFNNALEKEIIDEKNNPFKTYKFPPYERTGKETVTIKELVQWKEIIAKLRKEEDRHIGLFFLFGCWTGLRVSDWWQFDFNKHIVGNRIRLIPEKAKRSKKAEEKKWVDMEISPQLAEILNELKEMPKFDPKIFLITKVNRTIKRIAKRIGIQRNLSTHCARHTFAVRVCLDNGVSSETAAHLMGIQLKTFVGNYSKVTDEKVDYETGEAFDKILKQMNTFEALGEEQRAISAA